MKKIWQTNQKAKKRTLGGYLIRRYLSFSAVLILTMTLFYNTLSGSIIGWDRVEQFSAENIICEDYETIQAEQLADVDGWVEILDDSNRVIYTKGNVLREKEAYTQEELMRQCSIQNYMYRNNWNIGGFLNVTFKQQYPVPEYITTFKTFERGGKSYTGLVNIPFSKISAKISLMNPKGESGKRMQQAMLLGLGGCLLIYLLFLLRYSRTIQKHVGIPNRKLVDGLAEMTEGNYKTRVELNAEYEFREIERAFNQLGAELLQTSAKKDALEKERRQLLSAIAHDLRTPMTTIQGYSKALMEEMVADAQKPEYLNAIYRKSLHLNELITKLLEYSRLENDTYQLQFERTEFTEFVRQAVIEQYEEFEQHKIEPELDIPDTEIYTEIDRTEMLRVMINLMKNTLVHNPDGTSVQIRVEKIKDICSFSIWDNGTPITDEMKERIFEPFVSGDASRRTKNGSGLGLSICKKVVQRHDGTIQLLTKEDSWKGFVIHLPVSE